MDNKNSYISSKISTIKKTSNMSPSFWLRDHGIAWFPPICAFWSIYMVEACIIIVVPHFLTDQTSLGINGHKETPWDYSSYQRCSSVTMSRSSVTILSWSPRWHEVFFCPKKHLQLSQGVSLLIIWVVFSKKPLLFRGNSQDVEGPSENGLFCVRP